MPGKRGRPRKEKFTKTISLRLDFEDYRMLLRLTNGITKNRSDVMREALRDKYANSYNTRNKNEDFT